MCIAVYTQTHTCMYVTKSWSDFERLFVNTGQMQLKKELLLRFGMKDMVLYLLSALPAPLSLRSLAVVMNIVHGFQN